MEKIYFHQLSYTFRASNLLVLFFSNDVVAASTYAKMHFTIVRLQCSRQIGSKKQNGFAKCQGLGSCQIIRL